MMIRTRFAPSPTGLVHVGSIRTALYCYLLAKKNGGKFVLRIEDTDRERFVEGGVENILRSLEWVGLRPDEGVMFVNGQVAENGEAAPYTQSKRLDIYKKYADELIENNHAYYCFCTKERLDDLRATQQLNKLPTGYDGLCRNITTIDAKVRIAAGEKHVIRMKMPREGVSSFSDLIRGKVEFKNELIDDQVIVKSDGFPTYHLAVVVDDHLMQITHAIRGEEWLSSTPKHIVLFNMFGWSAPLYGHLPLLLNPDKSKLSKRQGDVAVEDYQKKGYLPEAILNFVAFLGWNPGTEKELFSLPELIEEFSVERINKAGAVFNLEKLDWYNQQHIKKMETLELVKRGKDFLGDYEKIALDRGDEWLLQIFSIIKDRIVKLTDIPELIKVFVQDDLVYEASILAWKKSDLAGAKNKLMELKNLLNNISVQDWSMQNLEQVIAEWMQKLSYDRGAVLWPLRVALSGEKQSPGPYELASGLGKEETQKRINAAIEKL